VCQWKPITNHISNIQQKGWAMKTTHVEEHQLIIWLFYPFALSHYEFFFKSYGSKSLPFNMHYFGHCMVKTLILINTTHNINQNGCLCFFPLEFFFFFCDIENLVIFSKVIQVIVKEQKHSIFSQFFFKKKNTIFVGRKNHFSFPWILFYFISMMKSEWK
jgi:hypothetical protein